MEEIKEALSNSAEPVNPTEKINEPELTQDEKIAQAKVEYEEAKQKQAEMVVEGISKGYEEAKKVATDIAHKTLSGWFFEKDLARQMNKDLNWLKNQLRWLDGFGMIEHKAIGAALQLKINRKPEVMAQKLLKHRANMMEKMAQLDVLLTIIAEDCPKPEEAKISENTAPAE